MPQHPAAARHPEGWPDLTVRQYLEIMLALLRHEYVLRDALRWHRPDHSMVTGNAEVVELLEWETIRLHRGGVRCYDYKTVVG